MKSLKQYITESVHTYNYTIKIAGEVDKNWMDMFKYNLKKFDPIDISDTINTPIQKSPYGFPNLENQPINIIKVKFRYPATEPMIQQMAQLLGYNVDMVRMIGARFDDSIDEEMQQYTNQMKNSPVLTHEQMEDSGKEASKQYAGSYLLNIKEQDKNSQMEMPFDGKKTPNAFDPFKPYLDDEKLGKKSPMTNITRPPKPKTGAMV